MTAVEKLLEEATAKGAEYAKLYNTHSTGKKSLKASRSDAMDAMDKFNFALCVIFYPYPRLTDFSCNVIINHKVVMQN